MLGFIHSHGHNVFLSLFGACVAERSTDGRGSIQIAPTSLCPHPCHLQPASSSRDEARERTDGLARNLASSSAPTAAPPPPPPTAWNRLQIDVGHTASASAGQQPAACSRMWGGTDGGEQGDGGGGSGGGRNGQVVALGDDGDGGKEAKSIATGKTGGATRGRGRTAHRGGSQASGGGGTARSR